MCPEKALNESGNFNEKLGSTKIYKKYKQGLPPDEPDAVMMHNTPHKILKEDNDKLILKEVGNENMNEFSMAIVQKEKIVVDKQEIEIHSLAPIHSEMISYEEAKRMLEFYSEIIKYYEEKNGSK